MRSILHHFHIRKVGGYFERTKTSAKVLQCGFYWPTLFKNTEAFVEYFNAYQKSGNISRKNEMPLNIILEVEFFDV